MKNGGIVPKENEETYTPNPGISEIREKRRLLEHAIAKLIVVFEHETTASISSLDIIRVDVSTNAEPCIKIVTKVSIKIKL